MEPGIPGRSCPSHRGATGASSKTLYPRTTDTASLTSTLPALALSFLISDVKERDSIIQNHLPDGPSVTELSGEMVQSQNPKAENKHGFQKALPRCGSHEWLLRKSGECSRGQDASMSTGPWTEWTPHSGPVPKVPWVPMKIKALSSKPGSDLSDPCDFTRICPCLLLYT